MRNLPQLKLQLISDKLQVFKALNEVVVPQEGWIRSIRESLNMTLQQLADRLKVSKEAVRRLEKREQEETVTLGSLRKVAQVLDMKLVYGFITKDDSLEAYVNRRAREVAREIIGRTHQQILLEGQQVDFDALQKAIEDSAEAMVKDVDRQLWT
jgi:predicted DNA-binding mobile mystery protein A